jgi:hypothetical protein
MTAIAPGPLKMFMPAGEMDAFKENEDRYPTGKWMDGMPAGLLWFFGYHRRRMTSLRPPKSRPPRQPPPATAPVAQWIEHLTSDQKVGSSSLSGRATGKHSA